MKAPAVVARYGGLPELRTALDAAVRAQQNNEVSADLAWGAARVLERVVLTVGPGVVWVVG